MSASPAILRPRTDSPRPAVVVTGIGLVTGFNAASPPEVLGSCREESWQALKAGLSAVRTLNWPESPPDAPPYLGAPASLGQNPGRESLYDLLTLLGDEALADAGLGSRAHTPAPDRVAVLLGLSKGGVRSLRLLSEELALRNHESPTASRHWASAWPSSGASWIAQRYGFQGPCLAPVAACATGLVAVIQGAELIQRGVCDVVLAGSADASIEPLFMAAFRKMKALARWQGEPKSAVRPWDRKRSGFVVGEGGSILVLESELHARKRGALPYAEVKGGALGADAYHETDLNPDPTGLADLIARGLRQAQVLPSDLDYVNVHGTATRTNDPLECQALHLVLGGHARRIACSANKSQIGHLLGAAGAVELALTCLSIRDGFIPPTLNLDDPDPACDLDGTPHVGRPHSIGTALKLSLGFGGHLAALVLSKPEGERRLPRNTPNA